MATLNALVLPAAGRCAAASFDSSAGSRLAVGRPQSVGVAGGEPAPVDVDLVVDEPEAVLQLSEPGGHVGAVGLQEGKSFLLVAGPGGYELGVASDGPDRHAGRPQPGADG